MVNYANGKIYKIEPLIDHDEGDIYIGSTTKNLLCQRMETHRGNYRGWKNGYNNKITSFNIFDKYGLENCVITLLETVNANSKDELHTRERYYIQSLKCVNKNIPTRTDKEYREDNKEILKQYHKQYNKDNVEKIKKYYEENKEVMLEQNKQYHKDNKEVISEQKKQYYENNKEQQKERYKNNREKILEQKKQYYIDKKKKISQSL
jgi:adenylate kinase family enzyme